MRILPELPERAQHSPQPTIFQTSGLQNSKTRNFCSFKPSSLWRSVFAALGKLVIAPQRNEALRSTINEGLSADPDSSAKIGKSDNGTWELSSYSDTLNQAGAGPQASRGQPEPSGSCRKNAPSGVWAPTECTGRCLGGGQLQESGHCKVREQSGAEDHHLAELFAGWYFRNLDPRLLVLYSEVHAPINIVQ